jgi:hypothetical protein
MEIGNGIYTIIGNPRIPTWNTTGRPQNPRRGTFGFNFLTNNLEYWTGTVWVALPMVQV